MRGAVVLLLCTACGRLAFDPLKDGRTSGDGTNGDGSIDAPPACSNWGPFSAPVHVDPIASAQNEYASAVSDDGLLVVFDTDRPTGSFVFDMWEATRTSVTAPFAPPVKLTAIDTASNEDNPAISPDGNTLYFSSNRSGQTRIWSATRTDRSQPFGAPAMLQGPITSPLSVCCAALSADEKTIYLSVDVTGASTDFEIYEASRPDRTSDFGTPTQIAAFSSPKNDWGPTISSDGLELFFHTDRGANYDILVSRRTTITGPWPPPVRVDEISSDMYSESDPTISYDGTTLWFAIFQGPQTAGNADVYYATRTCLGP